MRSFLLLWKKKFVEAYGHRNADAVVQQENGLLLFVEPWETLEPFSEFLDYIQQDSRSSEGYNAPRNVKYAQTRTYFTAKVSRD